MNTYDLRRAINSKDINTIRIELIKVTHFDDIHDLSDDLVNVLVEKKEIEMIHDLHEREFDFSMYGLKALVTASGKGDIETIKLLMEYGVEATEQYNSGNGTIISAIEEAVDSNQRECVDFFIDEGVLTEDDDVLGIAIKHGHKELFNTLINHVVLPAKVIHKGLVASVTWEKHHLLAGLLDKGADVNWNNGDCLCDAIFYGHEQVFNQLMMQNVTSNTLNRVLPIACVRGNTSKEHFNMFKVLLEKGAKVIKKCEGENAIAVAIEREFWEALPFLFEVSTSVEIDDAKACLSHRDDLYIQKLDEALNAYNLHAELTQLSENASVLPAGDHGSEKLLDNSL
ncbi:MAG: ankyrin repeat domain-containing protein [Endozoicomonadaceae bacterium]|nr:ankyrin repeat domain-containing protein [Endozoicomonadaceae bacterium]